MTVKMIVALVLLILLGLVVLFTVGGILYGVFGVVLDTIDEQRFYRKVKREKKDGGTK